MRIARQFMSLVLTRWSSLGLGFLTTVISARALGPERQGAVTLLLATPGILAIFLGAGLPTAAAYLIKQERQALGGLVGAITGFYAVMGVGVLLLVWTGRPWIELFALRQMGLEIDPLWLWLLVGVLIGVLFSSLLTPLLIVSDKIRLLTVWTVTSHALGLALTWLLLVALRLGITGALIANLCAQALSIGVLAFWLLRGPAEGRLRFRAQILIKALRIGAQQFLVSSFAALFKKGDSYILAALLNVRAVGYYSVASSLYDLVIDIPRTLVWLMVRETAERGTGDRERQAARSIRLQIPASIVLVAAAAILIPPFLPVVYGGAFRDAVVPFVVLLGGVPLRTIHLGVSAYFIGTGYPGAMLLPVVVAAVTSLGLDFAAVPRFGLVGAAMTTVFGELLLAALSVRAFLRLADSPGLRALVPSKVELRQLATLPIRLLRSPSDEMAPPAKFGPGE
ncbi:MAG: hypothetical protein A2W26_00490 [Acidobacteria bacterium RBG_16_64_8]|nr:MAG: hypothetical protein A2W26_00490 [Acidobacteria bacterium RBG_16_64_8]